MYRVSFVRTDNRRHCYTALSGVGLNLSLIDLYVLMAHTRTSPLPADVWQSPLYRADEWNAPSNGADECQSQRYRADAFCLTPLRADEWNASPNLADDSHSPPYFADEWQSLHNYVDE